MSMLLLQVKQPPFHLLLALTEGFREMLKQIPGQDCVFVEHIAGEVSRQAVEMYCRSHAYIL
jgi:hypothetical protein